MYHKIAVLFWLLLLTLLLSAQSKLSAAPIDDWQKLILDGSTHKFDGQYNVAIQAFSKAVALAESQKLPPKYLPISLCRLAEVEVVTHHVAEAEVHFQKIIQLIKQQKQAGTIDPQVNFWGAVLSDAYLSNNEAVTREKCLKRACYLKNLIYGSAHKESIVCSVKLACYYIDRNKIENAIYILRLTQNHSGGKDPDRLAETINHLAIKYKTDGKSEQAKGLELFVVDKALKSTTRLHYGLPAFYSLLGIISLNQRLNAESREYFKKALSACLKIKDKGAKKLAEQYIDLLIVPSFSDLHTERAVIAEVELKHILAMEQIISIDKISLFKPYSLLAAAIIGKPDFKYDEYAKCINSAIAIAKLPNSGLTKDIPDLYMRLGMIDPIQSHASVDFSTALAAETDKHGFHTTLVLFWWGWKLSKNQTEALNKLDIALKQAKTLSPPSRGTLLADILKLQADIVRAQHKEDLALSLERQSDAEIQLQKKLNSKLGPDFYHRM
jgi:tetratricopeptide (TPR) repeat protein